MLGPSASLAVPPRSGASWTQQGWRVVWVPSKGRQLLLGLAHGARDAECNPHHGEHHACECSCGDRQKIKGLSPAMLGGAGAGLRDQCRGSLSPECPGEGNSDGHKEAGELPRKGDGWGKILLSPAHRSWLWGRTNWGGEAQGAPTHTCSGLTYLFHQYPLQGTSRQSV